MNGVHVDEAEDKRVGLAGHVAYFRQKPFLVEAIQFTVESRMTCFNFVADMRPVADHQPHSNSPCLRFVGGQGMTVAYVRDWIVKTAPGQFYVMSDPEFHRNYDSV